MEIYVTKQEKRRILTGVIIFIFLVVSTLTILGNKNEIKKIKKVGAIIDCTVLAYTNKEAPNTETEEGKRYQSLLVNCPMYSNKSFTLFVNVERKNYDVQFDMDAPYKVDIRPDSLREGHVEYDSFILD